MQIVVKRAPFVLISARKRRLLAHAVKKVLGTPAHFDEGGTRWLVFSDPSIDWRDVRRLLAVVDGIQDFPDQDPPADRQEAFELVKAWCQSRLPAPAPPITSPASPQPEEWFERPWLRFTTNGMIPVTPNG